MATAKLYAKPDLMGVSRLFFFFVDIIKVILLSVALQLQTANPC